MINTESHLGTVPSCLRTIVALAALGFLPATLWSAQPREQDQILTWGDASLPAGSRFGASVGMARNADTAFAGAPQGKGWHLFGRLQNGTGPFLPGGRDTGGGDDPSYPACSDEFQFGYAVMTVTVHTSGTSRVVRPGALPYVSGIDGGSVRALANADDVVAVGQPGFSSNSGRVLLYRWDTTQMDWELDGTLFGVGGERFGSALAMRDNATLVVGGPGWGDNGRAKVFVHAAGVWSLWQTIESPALSQTGAEFGATVAADGPWIAIGSPSFDRLGVTGTVFPDVGTAYLYRPSGLSWALEQVARPPTLSNFDAYGSSIALREVGGSAVLVVGAPTDNVESVDEGSAFVWTLSGDGTWVERWQLLASDRAPESYFGTSVALGRSGILVGAPGADASGLAGQGAAYYFDHLVPLFADDFESADTSAWSVVTP